MDERTIDWNNLKTCRLVPIVSLLTFALDNTDKRRHVRPVKLQHLRCVHFAAIQCVNNLNGLGEYNLLPFRYGTGACNHYHVILWL